MGRTVKSKSKAAISVKVKKRDLKARAICLADAQRLSLVGAAIAKEVGARIEFLALTGRITVDTLREDYEAACRHSISTCLRQDVTKRRYLSYDAYSVANENAKQGLDVPPDVCFLCPGRPQLTNLTERSIHFAIFHSTRRAKYPCLVEGCVGGRHLDCYSEKSIAIHYGVHHVGVDFPYPSAKDIQRIKKRSESILRVKPLPGRGRKKKMKKASGSGADGEGRLPSGVSNEDTSLYNSTSSN